MSLPTPDPSVEPDRSLNKPDFENGEAARHKKIFGIHETYD
jgi:hypothetical protein